VIEGRIRLTGVTSGGWGGSMMLRDKDDYDELEHGAI